MPPQSLLQALREALRPTPQDPQTQEPSRPPRRVVVVGVGSSLRSDDAAGLCVAEELRTLDLPNVLVLLGHTAPENVTGEIRTFAPSHVLFVDAAEFGAAPGSVRIFESADIGGMTSSTHTLPLAVIADYLTGELGCRVLFLGLQPKGVEFGERLSEEVAAAVADTVAILAQALRESPSAHSGPGGSRGTVRPHRKSRP
jgi:hydrogenase 3 maturation protease